MQSSVVVPPHGASVRSIPLVCPLGIPRVPLDGNFTTLGALLIGIVDKVHPGSDEAQELERLLAWPSLSFGLRTAVTVTHPPAEPELPRIGVLHALGRDPGRHVHDARALEENRGEGIR